MKIPTKRANYKDTGTTITKMDMPPAYVPAENPRRQNRNGTELQAEWANCQTTTGDDAKLLLHNYDFL
jgi:hypothetical protein